jgi:hypothetical protein
MAAQMGTNSLYSTVLTWLYCEILRWKQCQCHLILSEMGTLLVEVEAMLGVVLDPSENVRTLEFRTFCLLVHFVFK